MLDTSFIFGLKLYKLIVQLQIDDIKFDDIKVDYFKFDYFSPCPTFVRLHKLLFSCFLPSLRILLLQDVVIASWDQN